jgi:hypothetical protein
MRTHFRFRTKKIITRAANAYTKLTRMDESIYHAYTDYIYDRANNVEFDIESLEVDDHPIDDEYIGSTAFTRAVRYNPVTDVLRSTEDAHAPTVTPTTPIVPDTHVADTGVDHTPPAPHAPADTGTALSPTDNVICQKQGLHYLLPICQNQGLPKLLPRCQQQGSMQH